MKFVWLLAGLVLLAGCCQLPVAQRDVALKLYLQGLLYESQSQNEQATASFQQAINRGADTAYVHVKLGQLALRKKDLKGAENHFSRALQIDPENAPALFGRGIIYYHQKKNELAIAHLEKGLQYSPGATAMRMILCDLLVAAGQYQQAGRHYELLLEENSRNPLFHFNYATVLEKLGQEEQAEKEFRRALELSPGFHQAAMALGLLYERTNRVSRAEALYRQLIQLNPKNHLPYLLLQGIYARKNDLAAVKRILEEGLNNGIRRLEFYQALASLALEEKEYQKAEEYLKKSLEIEETSQAYFSLGVIYDRRKEPERMEAAMKKAIELKPDNAMALNYLGYSFLLKKDLTAEKLKEAFALISKACEIEPDNGAFLDSLGWAYYLRGEYRQAEKLLLRAASLEEDPEIYEHLGYLYARKKDFNRAVLWWSKSLELKYNPEVDNQLQEIIRTLRK